MASGASVTPTLSSATANTYALTVANGSGGTVTGSAGSVTVTGFPAWLPAVGACVEIASGTTIGSAVRAMGGNSYGGTDPDDIVDPWSGGALVYVSGQPYLVVMGGGHGDSAFNGIVKFGPLFGAGSSTPTWSSFLAASAVGDVRDDFTYLDGRQTSTHSYNNLVGVGDTLYSVRTDGNYSTGNSSPLGFKFTPSGQTAIASYPGAGNLFCGTAHYDGRIYAIGGNGQFDQLRIYNIAANTYSTEGNAAIAFSNHVGGAVDSTRGKLLVIAGPGGGALSTSAYWDLGALTRQLNVDRPPGWIYSLMFDPDRDAFVSVQSGSLVVQEASAATLAAGSGAVWTTRTFTGPTLPATPPNGQYGRTQYVPELKGYIHAPGLESSVYFFRSA